MIAPAPRDNVRVQAPTGKHSNGIGVIEKGVDVIRSSGLNRALAFTDMEREPTVGACAICGRSLTQDGRCLRCLVGLGFLDGSQEPDKPEAGRRLMPGPLKYDHFQVEVGADGFPIELGSGAIATTYRARDTVLNSLVALKVIDRKVAEMPGVRSRFLREARAAAQIRHPNVARVTHYGEQDDECFYVMQLVEGETVEAKVRREGPMPLALALEVIEQAARALAAGEKCGVVHRDLKPSNIMLESDPSGSLIVKVIDYGIAKIVGAEGERGAEQTQAGFIGTPAFASPEQFAASEQTKIDTRSDIYSLGATFWYLLTGRVPFVGRTLREIAEKQTKELPIEQLKNVHVPTRVIALLKSMLAVDPAKRSQTTRELLSAIHRCYTKFSAEARSRRRRFALATAGAVLVVAAIAIGAWLYQRAQSSIQMERSIAVLPFENLSRDPDNAFFTDGVQDEILTNLAKVADLKVISRTSVMQYKSGLARNLRKIGEELGVAYVVEGSVQRAGNKVRVNAQLIDARNDRHEWAENYDRPIDDVFAIQSEIAKAIADQLQARLSPAEKNTIEQRPTADVVAFEQYSKAKTLMLSTAGGGETDRAYREAVDLLNSAVAHDPAFHAAFCQLVYANDYLYQQGYDHTPERLSAAEEALKKAAELRPQSADTRLARAQHLYYALQDYNGALSELDLARQGLPNDPRIAELTGYILRRQGKAEEGLRALQQAATLDPRNIFLFQQISVSYLGLRRYREAAATFDRALRIKPDDPGLGVDRASVDLRWRADPEPMCRFVERVRREHPESIPDFADNWFECAIVKRDWTAAEQALAALGDNRFFTDGLIQPERNFGEGLLARAMHDEARVRRAFTAAREAQAQVVAKQKDYAPALCLLGLIDAALGDKQAALEEGRRATELLPVSKDAINGPAMSAYFAMIAAWTGEKDLAIEHLSAVVQPGVYTPTCTHYGFLKTFPFWDPLRGDPRFEALVQQLAPVASSK